MRKILLLISGLCLWNLASAQFVFGAISPNCYGECNGEAEIAPTGTDTFHFRWSNGDNRYYTDNLCPGTYSCTVSNSLEEPIDTFTFVIFQPTPDNFIVTISNVSCEGGSDGSIDVLPTVISLGPYQFAFGKNDSNFTLTNTGLFTGLDTGSYTVLTIDGNGCFDTIPAPVGQTDTPCVAQISDIENSLGFTVGPDPANNNLSISLSSLPTHATIQILSADGRLVIQPMPVLQNHFEIDVSSLASGMYFIQLQDGQQSWVRKFVKE